MIEDQTAVFIIAGCTIVIGIVFTICIYCVQHYFQQWAQTDDDIEMAAQRDRENFNSIWSTSTTDDPLPLNLHPDFAEEIGEPLNGYFGRLNSRVVWI